MKHFTKILRGLAIGIVLIPIIAFSAFGGYAHLDATTGKVPALENDVASAGAEFIAGTATAADLKSTGTHAVYTVPAGKHFILREVYVFGNNIDTIVVAPTLNIGSESGTAQDWYDTAVLPAMSSGTGYPITTALPYNLQKVFNAGDVIGFQVSSAATATSYTADFYFIGILF